MVRRFTCSDVPAKFIQRKEDGKMPRCPAKDFCFAADVEIEAEQFSPNGKLHMGPFPLTLQDHFIRLALPFIFNHL